MKFSDDYYNSRKDLDQMKNDLMSLCSYDTDEPNYVRYNIALRETIENMSKESVLFALDDMKGLNND